MDTDRDAELAERARAAGVRAHELDERLRQLEAGQQPTLDDVLRASEFAEQANERALRAYRDARQAYQEAADRHRAAADLLAAMDPLRAEHHPAAAAADEALAL